MDAINIAIYSILIIITYISSHAESSDFTGISSMTLTLVPGQQEQCYSIDINDDDIDEQRECFQVNVVPDPNPSAGVSITQSTAMVCIIDNDRKTYIYIRACATFSYTIIFSHTHMNT